MFDLFDSALESAPLTHKTAAEQQQVLAEWGLEATLNEEPEPALPTTDGGSEEDEASLLAARIASAMGHPAGRGSVTMPTETGGSSPGRTYVSPTTRTASGLPLCPKCGSTPSPGDDIEIVAGVGFQHKGACPSSTPAGPAQHDAAVVAPAENPAQKAARLLAYADAISRGEQPAGPNPFEHVVATTGDSDIAAAAQQHLATKQALKTYSPGERQQIIDEGMDVKASNLDRLDIKGTHYEALEARASSPAAEDEDLTFLDGDPNLGDF